MKTVKVSKEVRKVLDDIFRSSIESCENTMSCEEFLARCDDSSGEIEISEEAVILASEV